MLLKAKTRTFEGKTALELWEVGVRKYLLERYRNQIGADVVVHGNLEIAKEGDKEAFKNVIEG